MAQMCASCKWGITVYKRKYKGVVVGCQNPNNKGFGGPSCYVPKDEKGDKDERSDEV